MYSLYLDTFCIVGSKSTKKILHRKFLSVFFGFFRQFFNTKDKIYRFLDKI
jgi:hypothetical protein